MDLSLRPSRTEGLQWCTLDEGGLISDPDRGHTWSLNPVGLFIWDHCDGHRDIGQLEFELQAAFGIDAATAHADLEAFLLDMEDQALIQLAWPAAS